MEKGTVCQAGCNASQHPDRNFLEKGCEGVAGRPRQLGVDGSCYADRNQTQGKEKRCNKKHILTAAIAKIE
jgi:hypothetical protein